MTGTAPRTPRQLVKAALVGLIATALLVGLSLNAQRLPLIGAGTTYRAEFADASGLAEGEEVRVAGLKVGTVTDLELGRGRVIVTFTVKGTRLGRETSASIEIKTLLGQHYLNVSPEGPGELDGGETIPMTRTTTPTNIVPAFQRVTKDLDQIDTAQLAHAFDALAESLAATAPEMKETLRGLSRLSSTIASRDEQVRRLFDQARQVTGTVAARDQEIDELLRDGGEVLALLSRRRAAITEVIEGTRRIATQLTGLIEDNQAHLGPILEDLNRVLVVLVRNRDQLHQTITYAHQYAKEFVSVGGSGRWLETTIKVPRSMSLCRTSRAPQGLSALLDPILSALNQAVNQSAQPCLPLGAATDRGENR